jgi:pyruvate formate lyase activating enzyme
MDAAPDLHPARHWHALPDGHIQCDVCPRLCKLHPGQRGLCFVRAREGDALVLTTYGRSSGFCIDPIEKKPLNHFLPGTPVFSFGTAGCNLTCKFCQNWDISKAREADKLNQSAAPAQIAVAARQLGCRSVAFTYNDPVIFLEYAADTALACHEAGLATVAVTAGYVTSQARGDFFRHIDAANVDLKGFTEGFYRNLCGGRLADVLETLVWLRHETKVWLEITTLLIPGENDGDA